MVKKILIGLGLLVVVIGMVLVNIYKRNASDKGLGFGGGKGIKVEAQRIYKGPISASVQATGKVEEVDKSILMTTLPIKITQVLVEEGETVKKGQKLFTVDLKNLEDDLNRLKVTQTTGLLQLKKLQEMSSTTSTVSAKIGVELADLSVVTANRLADRQTENLANQQILFDEGIISDSELDRAKRSLEDARSQQQNALLNKKRSQATLDTLLQTNSTQKNNLALDIEIQLKNLEGTDLSIAKIERQIEEIEDLMVASMTGIVVDLGIEEGITATTVKPLLTLVDMNQLKVKLDIKEYDIQKIEKGQSVVITGDAIGNQAEVIGEISTIAPTAKIVLSNNRQVTAIQVEVIVTKGSELLKPGYTADCDIMTQINEEAIVASFNMLMEDKKNDTTVYVVTDKSTVEERQVVLGITADFDVEILEGLEEGDLVVVNPSAALKDGGKVTYTEEPLVKAEIEEEN